MPTDTVIRAQIANIVSSLGIAEATRRLQMNRGTILALAGGAAVREGTLSQAAQRLGLVGPTTMAITSTPGVQA